MITHEAMMKGESEDAENVQAKFDGLTLRECDKEVTSEEREKGEKEKEESYTAKSQRVFTDGDIIFDVKLIQSNLQNTNIKFYKMSLIEDDNKKYKVKFRWGRSGTDGMFQIFECGSNLERAKVLFSRKFLDKTGNVWPTSFTDFKSFHGMYKMIDDRLAMRKVDTEPAGPAFVTGQLSIF